MKAMYYGNNVAYKCPCGHTHYIPVTGPKAWGFNWSLEKPTLTPSVVEWHPEPNALDIKYRCHHFLRDGRLEFLSDSLHEYAGKTVDLEDVPARWLMEDSGFTTTKPGGSDGNNGEQGPLGEHTHDPL